MKEWFLKNKFNKEIIMKKIKIMNNHPIVLNNLKWVREIVTMLTYQ